MRLFFQGESLQRFLIHMCNNAHRDVTFKISKVIISLVNNPICIRLTKYGLVPLTQEIMVVYPYHLMDKEQLVFLEDLASEAIFTSSYTDAPITAIGINREVMIITAIHGVRIFSTHSTSASATQAAGGQLKGLQAGRKRGTGSVSGSPPTSSSSKYVHWYISPMEILKAFILCVFRSVCFQDPSTKVGICSIVIQSVVHDIGLTQESIKELSAFVDDVCKGCAVVG